MEKSLAIGIDKVVSKARKGLKVQMCEVFESHFVWKN